jgi:hypothetical protein
MRTPITYWYASAEKECPIQTAVHTSDLMKTALLNPFCRNINVKGVGCIFKARDVFVTPYQPIFRSLL